MRIQNHLHQLTQFGLFFIYFIFIQGSNLLNAQEKMEKHITVKSTKVSLIPPKGFRTADNFAGFQEDSSGASITVIEMPAPFNEISKGLTKEAFLTKEMELVSKEEKEIDHYPAYLVKATQRVYLENFVKYILIFGDDQKTVMVNGTVPAEKELMGELIKESILTTIYLEEKQINPLQDANFEIDLKDSGLKFATSLSGTLLFSMDGKVPTASEDKTSLMAGISISKLNIENRKDFAQARIKFLPFQNLEIKETKEIRIDQMDGIAIIAYGKANAQADKELIYQVILFEQKDYYILLATANSDFDNKLKLFEQISSTFRRKK